MRTFISLLLTSLMALTALAAEKNTSIIVKQITDSQRHELPDKTLQIKLQRYELTDAPLAQHMRNVLQRVRDNDYTHTTYLLTLDNGQGTPSITLASVSDIKALVSSKELWGILLHDSACFLLRGDNNKAIFSKAKGKQTLIQEFEIVEDPVTDHPTTGIAHWQKDQFLFTTLMIEGSDQLAPAATPTDEPLPTQQE